MTRNIYLCLSFALILHRVVAKLEPVASGDHSIADSSDTNIDSEEITVEEPQTEGKS